MTDFEAVVVVTTDDAPLDKGDQSVNPSGQPSVALPSRRAPELSKPGVTFWLGELETSRVGLDRVRRLGLTVPGQGLVQVERLEGDLGLDGIDILQAQLGVRLVNRQQPRARYQT